MGTTTFSGPVRSKAGTIKDTTGTTVGTTALQTLRSTVLSAQCRTLASP
jgi:hypothetical protein